MQSTVSRRQAMQEQFGETVAKSSLAGTILTEGNWAMDDSIEISAPLVLATGPITETILTSAWEVEQESAAAPDFLARVKPYVPREVFQFQAIPQPAYRFRVLQKWEGTVTSVGDNEFVAVIRDLTDLSLPPEEATFSVEEVPEPDLSLISPGAIFYWNVGYETTLSRQRKRVSAIRFRRLPAWTRSDIEAVRRIAATLKSLFGLRDKPTESTGI